MQMDNSMKIRTSLALCVILGASFVSFGAADNPAQAAARVALEQILNHPDNSQIPSLPATNTFSEAVVEQPGKSAAIVTETVPEKAATPQTTPVAAPAAVAPAPVSPGAAPATVSHVAVAPAPVAPVAAAPARSFVIIALLILSPLLVSIVIMSILLLKLRQLKLLLLKHPAVMASSKIQPAAVKAGPSTERRGTSDQRLKAEG
jgi:hypothetical protein